LIIELKERLTRHLPELIYKGTIRETKAKLSSGKTPNTVDFDEALERLEIGPRVVFSQNDLKVIKRIQEFRNFFEHYEIIINPYQIWGELSKFVTII